MTSSTNAAQLEIVIANLKTNSVFADLSPEDLTWLAERMEDLRVPAGEVIGRKGDSIDHLNVLLEGEIQVEFPEEPGTPRFIARKGQITGALPFSRLKSYMGTARASLPLHALRLHMQYFPELLQRIPVLGYRLVAVMSDRIRETTRQEVQRDKLMALGKLSAGLAHELNNPAAAAQRAAKSLKEAMDNVRIASLRLLQHPLTNEQRMAVFQFEREVTDQVAEKSDAHLDPIQLSDLEAELTECLEEHKVQEPWKIAGPLAEANVDLEKMEALRINVGDDVLIDALRRVAAVITIFRLIHEIDNSTKRISELVTAIKRYSYMDQAALQEVDLREDLDNTIKIFGHWLKKGITVKREYDHDLPKVCAYGSELNQVWTNLMDNAIDAMNGQGELRIRARRDLDAVCIEIGDTGPGIPAEIKSRIFDPFFTTKPVGEGTGLGLDTAMRIVQKHHGTIEVKSKPGETRFLVRVPLQQPRFHSNSQPKQEQEAPS
ncbi:MAG TPA: ATP-binding protein [Candidatus Eisenbacteria bacterium]|nr:ATP-binding protein [Candidatus Eisenbacteria bacterium]